MRYSTIGGDMDVSRICLGCMGFGNAATGQHSWTVDEGRSRAVIRSALDSGINFFDTAIGYQDGTSERYLGRALNDMADRDSVYVATKFLPRTQEEIDSGVGGREHVLRSLDLSLEHLGMDRVDLLIYHMWDHRTPLEDIMQGLKEAMASGRVGHIGISNCYAWQLCKANRIAESMGMEGFVSVQNHYNLIFREEEREMAPFCRSEGIAMTPYSPLASGRLSRPPGEDTKRLREDSYARLKYDSTAEQDAKIIERVREVSESKGVPMAQVSLAWLMTRADSPVAGATSPEQAEGLAGAAELELSKDEVAYLEEPYVPHRLVGVMAQNTPEAASEKHVWTRKTV